MVAWLIGERNEAENTPDDLKALYSAHFMKMGFTKLEFYKLAVKNGKQVQLKEGDVLSLDGQVQNKMYYLIDGSVDVRTNDVTLANIKPNAFIGELTFLVYLQEIDSKKESVARASCIISSETALLIEWDFESLSKYLESDRNLKNSLQAFISNDLRKKLASMTPNEQRVVESNGRVLSRVNTKVAKGHAEDN